MSDPTPPAWSDPVPHVRGASEAAEFYKRAFAAEELGRHEAGDGKRLMHCHLCINGADVMMSDEFPSMAMACATAPRV